MSKKSCLHLMLSAWLDLSSAFAHFRNHLNHECEAFVNSWATNPPEDFPDTSNLWSQENIEFMGAIGMSFMSRKERFYYVATGLLKAQRDWIFIPTLQDETLIKVTPMIACPATGDILNPEIISLDFDNPETRKRFASLTNSKITQKEAIMTNESNLQSTLDTFGNMNQIFEDYRQDLNKECAAFLAEWTTDPPVELPDRNDLWSNENVEFMAHQGMHLIPKKAQFYYIATGLLNGGDGEHSWVFIPMLHDERHIDINIMIACPAMDSVQNVEAMRTSFKYPQTRTAFVALAHGENPYPEDTQ